MSLSTNKREKRQKMLRQTLWFFGLYLASLIGIGGFMFMIRSLLGMH